MIKNDLSLENMTGLVEGSIAAIMLHNFYPHNLCASISEKLNKDFRRGFLFKDVLNSFDEIIDATSQLRKVFHPYQSPIDFLNFILDEIHPIYNHSNRIKICHILETGGRSPTNYVIQSLLGQIAANIYLSAPQPGETLQLSFQKNLNRTVNLELKPEQGDFMLFNIKSDYVAFFSKTDQLNIS